LKSLDDYQQYLTNVITPWPREQRIALAAAMAERWLPVYESFSEEEDWGDPSILQRAVEAVWNCALGTKLTRKDHGTHKARVEENMPHVDDFASDVEEALATAAMVDYALDCCVSDDNTGDVVMALVSGFEGVAPGIHTDEGEFPPGWDEPQFKDELRRELKPLIDNAAIDQQEMDVFHEELKSLPAVTQDGVGPLPEDVWESPEVKDHLKSVFKLRSALSDIIPIVAQKIQTLRQKPEAAESNKRAEQAALNTWNLPQVQDELKKQLEMIKLIGELSTIDQKQIKALRPKLTSSGVAGTVAPRPDPRMTNEAVFERYRRLIESDLKQHQNRDYSYLSVMREHGMIATHYLSEWASRYSRRKLVLEGNQVRDVVGRDALLARYSKNDAAVQGDPGWDENTRTLFENSYRHIPSAEGGFEVRSPYEPHSYGPSLRQLCIERRLAGDSDQDVWDSILQWALHQPAAWEEEDRRKKKKLAYSTPGLAERLARELSWRDTNDVDYPWATEVSGETWRVGLNDFPDDLMYTLVVDDKVIGKFHDWPQQWLRDMVG